MSSQQNPIEQLKQWYTLTKRREVTFQKLYEHPYLSRAQIENLKTAQALYEVIPLCIYVPYAFVMMRVVAKSNNASKLIRFTCAVAVTAPVVEVSARYLRDRYYWPIVRDLYLQVKEQQRKAQNPFSLMQKLKLPSLSQQSSNQDDSVDNGDVETRDNLEKLKNENETYRRKVGRVWKFFNSEEEQPKTSIKSQQRQQNQSQSSSLRRLQGINVRKIHEKSPKQLGDYLQNKKAVIIVNVASECGLTKTNYSQLTEIYNKYKDQGLEILGFPCNQFGEQEPGSDDEIAKFACEVYQAEFPLFEKVEVNGDKAHELYKYLKENSTLNDGSKMNDISWNFAKFIVDENGNVVKYAGPEEDPNSLIPIIEQLLGISK